ncbi:MAG: hypothetical protein ACRD3Q_02245 [Terriglobales bacterium]
MSVPAWLMNFLTPGNGQPQTNAGTAATAATQAGTAGTAGAAVANASGMPQWMKGLMGATTGNPAYGQNAPAVHSLLAAGMGALSQPTNAPPMMPQRRPMAAGPTAAPPGVPASAAPPINGAPPWMGSVPQGMPMQGAGMGAAAPGGMPGINPQLLAQLRAQYPAMFGSSG